MNDRPRCPECGELAEFEKCRLCDGGGVDDINQRCAVCNGFCGRYFCEFCLELERKAGGQ